MVIRVVSHPVVALVLALFLAGSTRFLTDPTLDLILWLLAAAVGGMAIGEWIGGRQLPATQGGPATTARPLLSALPLAPVLPLAPAAAPRVFTQVSLQYLFQLGKTPNLTDAQTRKLALPYQGQWIAVEGIIANVDPAVLNAFRQVSVTVTNPDRSTDRVLAYFRGQLDLADALPKGAPIRLIGQIDHVAPTFLSLDPCEFA